MKTPKFYVKEAAGAYHMCKDCGKTFNARDEATCLKFMKLHITKAHSEGVSIKHSPPTKREVSKLNFQAKGMNISQAKLVSK
jgi:hypothetical protein